MLVNQEVLSLCFFNLNTNEFYKDVSKEVLYSDEEVRMEIEDDMLFCSENLDDFDYELNEDVEARDSDIEDTPEKPELSPCAKILVCPDTVQPILPYPGLHDDQLEATAFGPIKKISRLAQYFMCPVNFDEFEENRRKKKMMFDVEAYKSNKELWIRINYSSIRNGYYIGFFASLVCLECNNLIDGFPCKQKRVYWVSSKRCPYCKGIKKPIDEVIADRHFNRTRADNMEHRHFIIRDPDPPQDELSIETDSDEE